jgi:hypothetical protein
LFSEGQLAWRTNAGENRTIGIPDARRLPQRNLTPQLWRTANPKTSEVGQVLLIYAVNERHCYRQYSALSAFFAATSFSNSTQTSLISVHSPVHYPNQSR